VCSCCWDSGVFGVCVACHPYNTITRFKTVEFACGAERHDCAFCFAAEDFGFWGGVETRAVVAACCQPVEMDIGKEPAELEEIVWNWER